MSGKYDDIINLPYPTSAKHPRMPISDRAAIFSPFAALTGHGDGPTAGGVAGARQGTARDHGHLVLSRRKKERRRVCRDYGKAQES